MSVEAGKCRYCGRDCNKQTCTHDVNGVLKTTPWERNEIQFPRLLAEINAVAFEGCEGEHVRDSLLEAMDLTSDELDELFDRADFEWARIKASGEPVHYCKCGWDESIPLDRRHLVPCWDEQCGCLTDPREHETNAERIKRTLETEYSLEPLENVLEMALADIRHLCDASSLDFAQIESRAKELYYVDLNDRKRVNDGLFSLLAEGTT